MITTDDIKRIKRIIKAHDMKCKITRIGTGKNIDIGLHGAHAEHLATALCAAGFERTPMSGTGTRTNPITIKR
jgi:hypothetical protein